LFDKNFLKALDSDDGACRKKPIGIYGRLSGRFLAVAPLGWRWRFSVLQVSCLVLFTLITFVIGIKKMVREHFLAQLPGKFAVAKNDVRLPGVIVDVDETGGRSAGIERLSVKMGER
jgi:hypothetical protein